MSRTKKEIERQNGSRRGTDEEQEEEENYRGERREEREKAWLGKREPRGERKEKNNQLYVFAHFKKSKSRFKHLKKFQQTKDIIEIIMLKMGSGGNFLYTFVQLTCKVEFY